MIVLGDVLALGPQPWPRYDRVRRPDKLTTFVRAPAISNGVILKPDWHYSRDFFTANMERIHQCQYNNIARSVPSTSPTARCGSLGNYCSTVPSRDDSYGSDSVRFTPHFTNQKPQWSTARYSQRRSRTERLQATSDLVSRPQACIVGSVSMGLLSHADGRGDMGGDEGEIDCVRPMPDIDTDSATSAQIARLHKQLKVTRSEVTAMVASRPALLVVPTRDVDARVEGLKTLLAGTERELGAVFVKLPHLLLADIDEPLRRKVEWLVNAGLTISEVRALFATHPRIVRVDLNVMQEGVDALKEMLVLAPRQLGKVIVGRPSTLTSSRENVLTKLTFYLDVLRLTKEELRSLVIKDPTILRLSVDNLREKMAFFMEELGMRRLQLTKLVKEQPHVLGLSVAKKMRPNVAYLENDLDIPSGLVRRVIVAAPGLLWFSIENNLRPKVRWLTVELLLGRDHLRKAVTANPQVLSLSLDGNLIPKVSWLKETFGADDLALRDMVARHPAILIYSVENMKRKMSFFTEELGVEMASMCNIVLKAPSLLSYSVDSMRTKVSHLKEELQLDDDNVTRIICRNPSVLKISTANFETKVAFIRQKLSASPGETSKIISKFPAVLNLSVDKNLQLTLDFFTEELRGSSEAVRDAIVKTPTLLGYSLPKRIKPRFQVMRSAGIEPSFTEHVWHVTSYTGLRFSRWLERCVVANIGAEGRGDVEVRDRMAEYRAVLKHEAT